MFTNTDFLFLAPYWLAGLIPTWIGILWLIKRKKEQGLIAPHLAEALGVESKKQSKHIILAIGAALSLMLLALSSPSFQKQQRPAFEQSAARVLILDMSQSMYATDIKPNRLTQARYKALDILDRWQEGLTGLVVYAGDAYSLSPLTRDTNTLKTLIPNISPEIVPYQGADASRAVKLAMALIEQSGNASGELILFTDDIDDQEKQKIEQLLQNQSWSLRILAVATRSGAPIKLSDGELLKRSNGQPVIASSHFSNMSALAKSVGGEFVSIRANDSDIDRLSLPSQSKQHSKTQESTESRVNNGFWFMLFILPLAALLFRKGLLFSVFALSMSYGLPDSAFANEDEATVTSSFSINPLAQAFLNDDQEAMKAFRAQDYSSAAELFTQEDWKGISEYKEGHYDVAASTLSSTDSFEGQFHYANSLAQQHQYEHALDTYRALLPQANEAQKHIINENIQIVEDAMEKQSESESDSKKESGENQNKDSGDKNGDNSDSQGQNGSDSSDNQQQDPKDSDSQSSDSQEDGSQGKNAQQNDSQENQPSSNEGQPGEEQADHSDQQRNAQSQKEQDNREASGSEQQQQQQQQQQHKSESSEQNNQSAISASQSPHEKVDPELRQLEKVEAARDPSRLLQNQLILQARDKQRPPQTGKQW
ncbi:VWA domain-containing protein [Vibrio sp.]|nr:VWA domain-containing protein [Vibrio sp.]